VQYMLLIYHDEERWNEDWEAMSEEERRAFLGEYFALDDEARRAGALVSGEALQRTASATTVRVRDGEQLVTDGPFAETKEQLGGFYVVEAESLDETIEWAAKIPTACFGSVEVRPVQVIPAEVPQ
jgi:hypothetical protein